MVSDKKIDEIKVISKLNFEPEIDSIFEVLFEDELVLIVSKSGNCPVHEGGLYITNCLTKILETKYNKRFYPVYRLDRETSGIVVFAKNSKDIIKIKSLISDKEYCAVCFGIIDTEIMIDKPIGECVGNKINWKKCVVDKLKNQVEIGAIKNVRNAKTIVYPISHSKNKLNNQDYSFVRIILKSGRQHQIRVHLSSNGNYIIGDKIYGKDEQMFLDFLAGKNVSELGINRQALHLRKIKYSDKIIEITIPKDIIKLIKKLKLSN